MYTKNLTTPLFARKQFSSRTSDGNTSVSPEGIWVSEFLQRTGESVPLHKRVIKSGGNATSFYSLDATRILLGDTSGQTTMSTRRDGPEGNLIDTHFFQGVPLPIEVVNHETPLSADLDSEVLTKIYDRLRSDRSVINGLNFVGELREAISMIKRPLASIRDHLGTVVSSESKQISAMRKLRSSVKRRDAFAKMVSGTALEINFGWKPFVSDIKAIAEGVAKQVARPLPRDRIRAVARTTAVRQEHNPRLPVGGRWGYQFVVDLVERWETEQSIQYVVGLNTAAAVASSAIERLATDFGFTAENILPAAYELTPWSWMLDYFTNVGDIINASATATSNVVWVCKTVKTKTTFTRQCTGVKPFDDPVDPYARRVLSFSGLTTRSVGVRTTMSRSPATLGIPKLILKTPFSSSTRVTNLLSVMEQQRRSVRF